MAEKQLCLEIIKELNETELKLILLYELTRKSNRARDSEFEKYAK